MPPTLAGRWLLPLLPSLRAVMPDVDVRVTTYDAWEPRFGENGVDAAIVQGHGEWPDVEAVALLPELLTPVCSAEVAKRLVQPTDLGGVPLLHCDPLQGWALWLDRAGVRDVVSHRGQTFDTLELALSAATRGQGVALGDLNLVRESLSDRVLVAPFDVVLDRGLSYFLVYPRHTAVSSKLCLFRDWIVAEATRYAGEHV